MKIILMECVMDLKRTVRYKVGIISDTIIFTILLLVFLFSDTGSSFQNEFNTKDYKPLLMLGYIAWSLASIAISVVTYQISSEVQRGTFYMKLNSGYPLQLIYLGDFLSAGITQTGIVIFYSLICWVLFQVSYGISIQIVFSLIVGSIGMYGIGLIIAGMCLAFKKVNSFMFLIQLMLLFVTDTVPTSDGITSITNIIPLTLCNKVIRKCFLSACSHNEFVMLCISSALFLAVGWIIFQCFFCYAKRKGILLMY